MKTILTLKTSSMFFVGSVNLYKGIPSTVEVENLSPSTIRIVNQAITSGRIESTEGLLELPIKEDVVEVQTEAVVVEEAPEVTVEDTEQVAVEETPVAEEAKPAPKKRATPAKKTVK